MKAEFLKGSKQQIAETVARISGEVHEAIVFVEEPSEARAQAAEGDIFAEMEPFTVKAGGANYTRDALYTRMPGE